MILLPCLNIVLDLKSCFHARIYRDQRLIFLVFSLLVTYSFIPCLTGMNEGQKDRDMSTSILRSTPWQHLHQDNYRMLTNLSSNVVDSVPSTSFYTYDGWTFDVHKSTSIPPSPQIAQLEGSLGFPLPTITFPFNQVYIKSNTSSFVLKISCLDALKALIGEKGKVDGVAVAPEWRSNVSKSFSCPSYDWTYFPTNYHGVIIKELGNTELDDITLSIDFERLSRKDDPVLFYTHLLLYEDELSDWGYSSMDFQLRVMEWCWYGLLRQSLRVDRVKEIVKETRFYCPFTTTHIEEHFVIVERKEMERSLAGKNVFTNNQPLFEVSKLEIKVHQVLNDK